MRTLQRLLPVRAAAKSRLNAAALANASDGTEIPPCFLGAAGARTSGLGELASWKKFLTQIQPAGVVHGKHVYSSASGRRCSLDLHADNAKVIRPPIPARVKKCRNYPGEWIDAGEVRSLSEVAPMAGKGQIRKFVRAPVLLGNDVLDVVRKRRVLLPEQAVFAPIPGSPADHVPRFRVGHGRAFEVSLR